ncbi:MAG TPA: thiosulfate sulfurtransferase GlpE [Desulfomonilaceae bacterium]|nr:thiosulfate sulfurtransferase GlpE [Desulfomonilaceae bacterium]
MARPITPEDLKTLLAGNEKPAVFDVRRRGDFEAAPQTISRAVWLDPEKADDWSDEIPRDRPIVVYCVKGGSVSQSIAEKLEQGHANVRFLQGGIRAWVEAGERVEEDR